MGRFSGGATLMTTPPPMRLCVAPAISPILPGGFTSMPTCHCFGKLHRSGIIYSVDRSANPWAATIFAVASQPESQYYDDLDTAYHEALRYYDENVGARLHQS